MKSCPQCSRTYPDSEKFCAVDGSTLAEGAPQARMTQAMPTGDSATSCPVCGGKADPGEEICRYCGAKLILPAAAAAVESKPRPASAKLPEHRFDSETGPIDEEKPSFGRRIGSILVYSLAALIALGAGAYFAVYLSSQKAKEPQVAMQQSPVASPGPSPGEANAPMAVLASNMAVSVTGESASSPERNESAARKIFDDNQNGIVDTYRRSLEGDSNFHDGALVSLRIAPSGDVLSGAVKTSTSPNPDLDARLVTTMSGWHFAPFSGGEVEVAYPLVMARNAAERAEVESRLQERVASLGAGESPEYASAPPAPTPAAEAAAPSAPGANPPEATAAPEAPPERLASKHEPRHRLEPPAPRKPSLQERVEEELHANKNLRRVHAYSNAGTVTLYGKVFDENAKSQAERTARHVDGVTHVVDNLTTDTSVWAENESKISQALQNAGLGSVTVKVIGHDAYLDGEVSNDQDREHAATIAESTAPVRVRTNLVRVKPKGMFGF